MDDFSSSHFKTEAVLNWCLGQMKGKKRSASSQTHFYSFLVINVTMILLK